MIIGADPFTGGHAHAQTVPPHGTPSDDLSNGKLTSAQSMVVEIDSFTEGHACVMIMLPHGSLTNNTTTGVRTGASTAAALLPS